MAYANRDPGNVLGAAETAGMTVYLDHPSINPKQSKHWALDIAVAFPTLLINLSPGGFWSHRFWPISVNRTRWEAAFHVPKPLTGRDKLQQDLYITRITEILLEAVTNTERTHHGIAADTYEQMQRRQGHDEGKER